MLKTAILFAASSLVIAGVAPTFMPTLFSNEAPPKTSAPAPAAQPEAQPEAVAPPAQAHYEPAPQPTSWDLQAVLPGDALGHYWADVLINGQYAHMMIDTGASYVVLSADVADRIGLSPTPFEPRASFSTGNGLAYASPTVLSTVRIGSIYFEDVRAYISDRKAGNLNVIGMNLLKRLHGVEQRDGYLYLRQ